MMSSLKVKPYVTAEAERCPKLNQRYSTLESILGFCLVRCDCIVNLVKVLTIIEAKGCQRQMV